MTHEHQQESVKSIKVRESIKDAKNKLISGEAARHIFSTKINFFGRRTSLYFAGPGNSAGVSPLRLIQWWEF